MGQGSAGDRHGEGLGPKGVHVGTFIGYSTASFDSTYRGAPSGADANSTDTDQGQPQPRQTWDPNLRVNHQHQGQLEVLTAQQGITRRTLVRLLITQTGLPRGPGRLLPLDDSQINRCQNLDLDPARSAFILFAHNLQISQSKPVQN